MKTILVAGGAGYLGSVLIPKLIKLDYAPLVYDKFFFRSIEDTRACCQFGDTRDIDIVFLEGAHTVIDLACLSNDPTCDLDEKLTYAINYEAPVRLAKLAKKAGVKRYIYSSSCSVYGDGNFTELTEESTVNPISLYAKLKYKVEQEILKLNSDEFKVVALRSGTMFGFSPRMRFDLIVNIMTMNAWRDKIIKINSGRQWRPLVHINDVCEAFLMMCGNKETGIFNVGGFNHRVLEVAMTVRDYISCALDVVSQTPDKRDYNVCFDKIEALGYKATHNLAYGINEIKEALDSKVIDPNDPRTNTVAYYKYLQKEGRL